MFILENMKPELNSPPIVLNFCLEGKAEIPLTNVNNHVMSLMAGEPIADLRPVQKEDIGDFSFDFIPDPQDKEKPLMDYFEWGHLKPEVRPEVEKILYAHQEAFLTAGKKVTRN